MKNINNPKNIPINIKILATWVILIIENWISVLLLINISKINNNWANAGALPVINISVKREEVLSDQTKNPASFIQEKLRSTSYKSNANINWTLFNGFAI